MDSRLEALRKRLEHTVIRPFVDRLINGKVLPKADDYSISWDNEPNNPSSDIVTTAPRQ